MSPQMPTETQRASHGTTDTNGSIFTLDPKPVNPPKRSFVSNVHKNSMSHLFKRIKDRGRIAAEVGNALF
jgi:hypothetical protein